VLLPAVINPLLEAIRHRSGATGVYFYRFDRDTRNAHLVGWAGAPCPGAIDPAGIPVAGHLDRESPIVLHHDAWRDPRFTDFPEIRGRRLEGVVSIPLIHDGAAVGILNIGRERAASTPAGDLAALLGLSLPMGALLAAGAEYAHIAGQLADRKILERAKGILQARLAWTEEQAYLHLRRASRNRRTAMRVIAREVVEGAQALPWEARRAS
jgi:hypothetical protein